MTVHTPTRITLLHPAKRASFLTLQMIIGTVTCRHFPNRLIADFDIRSTENLRSNAATSRFTAINVTASAIIHDGYDKCNNYFCIFFRTIIKEAKGCLQITSLAICTKYISSHSVAQYIPISCLSMCKIPNHIRFRHLIFIVQKSLKQIYFVHIVDNIYANSLLLPKKIQHSSKTESRRKI